MQLVTNNPIQMNIIPSSGSTLVVKFILRKIKEVVKLNLCVHVYYKHPVNRNMIDVVTSDTLSAYTLPVDMAYRAYIKIPEFKNFTWSYLLISVDPNSGPYAKAFIEDIKLEFSSQEIDISKMEEVEIPKALTMSGMIDLLVSQYKKNLPKDTKNRIFYIRPWTNDSFGIVSHNHISYIRENKANFEIVDMNWGELDNKNWNEKINVLLHPFLYPFASPDNFNRNMTNFAKLLAAKNKIGGFDVADSNRISPIAVDFINKIDLIMVPSSFAKKAYKDSGITIPIEVLPHGILDEFLNDDSANTNNADIIGLKKLKEKGNILVLFFLVHSIYRKGSDIVAEVMKKIQKFPNVYLIVKCGNYVRANFPGVRTVEIKSWMDNNDLKLLYDTCDICLSPSRGGGFELNALEAVSRGLPTLVPNGCCFLDLIDYFIPIKLSGKVTQPLPGNPVHVGYGCEVDINDFETKLTDVINRLDYWKTHFRENSKRIREEYTWRNTAKTLEDYLKHYGFVD